MNANDASLLECVQKDLDELIEAGKKHGPLYALNPKLVADITRKGKWLRAAIKTFQDSTSSQDAQ